MKNQILRIIGGKWRSRQLTFPSNVDGLRPTADRIRETIFNWLQSDIINRVCLDVFSGSGALGLEALSRGAKSCTFIEKSRPAYLQLQKNLKLLDAQNANCLFGDALKILESHAESYDLIFLDPPFKQQLLPAMLNLIDKKALLKPNGFIYFEADIKDHLNLDNTPWQLYKEKTTGNVRYGLLQLKY